MSNLQYMNSRDVWATSLSFCLRRLLPLTIVLKCDGTLCNLPRLWSCGSLVSSAYTFSDSQSKFLVVLLISFLISQEQNFSMAMQRRCIALLCGFSTAMLILSNLVFLGGIHVGRIFWKRVFVQGKWLSMALTLQESFLFI